METKTAAFALESFTIKEFSFKFFDSNHSNISLKLFPSGEYNPNNGVFELNLKFIAETANSSDVEIKTTLTAYFRFSSNPPENLEQLPGYFYKNAIAIIFPYLRSFISTLTLQANIKPLIIPVLNLSSLEQPFRESTILKKTTEVGIRKTSAKKRDRSLKTAKKITNKKSPS